MGVHAGSVLTEGLTCNTHVEAVHALRRLVRRTLASVQPLLLPSPRRSCRRCSRVRRPCPSGVASSSPGLTAQHACRTQLHLSAVGVATLGRLNT